MKNVIMRAVQKRTCKYNFKTQYKNARVNIFIDDRMSIEIGNLICIRTGWTNIFRPPQSFQL
jgi:hypothetical protein